MTKRFIGLDLDGVIRHNNKSMGTGDIPIEYRTKDKLRQLSQAGELPPYYYITKPEDIRFIDGALDALQLFHELEINQYVFTNQEAIGVGAMDIDDWEIVYEVMDLEIHKAGGNIDNWYWCPHAPDENCECRKPKPGMLLDFLSVSGLSDLSDMLFIGDNPSDMEAAHRAGCGYKIHIVLDGADDEFKHSEYANTTASSLKDARAEILKWVFMEQDNFKVEILGMLRDIR